MAVDAEHKKRVKDMTPEEKKLYQNEAKRWSREKQKGALPGSDEETLQNRRAQLELERAWEAAWAKATDEERLQVGEWNSTVRMIELAIEALAEPESEETNEFLAIAALEIEAFAKAHPPSQDSLYVRVQNSSAKHAGYAEIQRAIKSKALPPLASKFGIFADHITPIYNHFVWKVRERHYKRLHAQYYAQQAVAPPLTEAEQRANAAIVGRTL